MISRGNRWSHFAFLETAIRLDVPVVQYLDNLPLHVLTDTELDRLAGRAAEANVAIEVGIRGMDIELLRTYRGLAQRLGSPFVRIMVDKKPDEPTPAEVVARLRPLIPEFADAGIRFAIENQDRFAAASLVEIVEDLGRDHAGVCLDTINSFGALEGTEVLVKTLAPYTINLHLKDFNVRRQPHQLGFLIEGMPAGAGRLNVPWLLAQLPENISVILELWPPLLPTMAETVALEQFWLERSIANLKPLI